MAEYVSKEAVKNEFGELFTLCRETLPNENGHHFVVEKELQIAFDHLMSLPAADVVDGEMYMTVLNIMENYADKLIEIREVLAK